MCYFRPTRCQEMPYGTQNSGYAARKTEMGLMGICNSKKAKYNKVYP